MFKYNINADLKTDIFKENYNKNVYFLCKTVDFIDTTESIDNYYFFSHNKFYRLTEYKDHIKKNIFTSDDVSDNFILKEYGNKYKRVYTLPMTQRTLQSTGIIHKEKASLISFSDIYIADSEIYNVNKNLNNFLIVTNGIVEVKEINSPIGIICTYPRMRVEKEDFFKELKIPIVSQSMDEKIEYFKRQCEKVTAFGINSKKIEDIILN